MCISYYCGRIGLHISGVGHRMPEMAGVVLFQEIAVFHGAYLSEQMALRVRGLPTSGQGVAMVGWKALRDYLSADFPFRTTSQDAIPRVGCEDVIWDGSHSNYLPR